MFLDAIPENKNHVTFFSSSGFGLNKQYFQGGAWTTFFFEAR